MDGTRTYIWCCEGTTGADTGPNRAFISSSKPSSSTSVLQGKPIAYSMTTETLHQEQVQARGILYPLVQVPHHVEVFMLDYTIEYVAREHDTT